MTRPPPLYRALRALVRGLLALFFREVAVEGRERLPAGRGGLLVSWHPNGLIDPAVILARFPGQIVFGARDGLLRWPVVGLLMRRLGTVPVYRPQDAPPGGGAGGDAEARRVANRASLDALAAAAAAGRWAALFPEGVSHDDARPAEVRGGAARLYGRALARARAAAAPEPALVPVGLHYDDKATFRSRVLVAFHAPLDLPADLRDALAAGDDDAHDALTARVDAALDAAALAVDDWDAHRRMDRARTLLRAELAARSRTAPAPETPAERLRGLEAVWAAYTARAASHPAETAALAADVDAYSRLLRAMRLADADLDGATAAVRPREAAWLAGRVLGLALGLPLMLVGALVSGPAHRLLKALARRYSTARKDMATVKLLGGLVLYPLSWLAAGALAVALHGRVPGIPVGPVAFGLLAVVLSAAGAAVAVVYGETARETAAALRVRLTRERRGAAVERLRTLRARLADRLLALAEAA